MSQIEPTTQIHKDFSEPDATPPPWAEVSRLLADSEMFWLSTVRGDGRPHVTPLPAIWLDGALHFATGAQEQKTKNLESNPHCVLTAGPNRYRSGLDAVVEGDAVRVTDADVLGRLAALWKSKLDWHYEAAEEGFLDEFGRTILVFGVRPAKVLAFSKGPYSQTRYRFTE